MEEKPQGSVWLRGLEERGAPDPESQTELKSITIARAEAIEAEQTQHTRPFSRNSS